MMAHEFIRIADRLRRAYPKVGLFGNPELLEIWWLALSDLDGTAIGAAADEWIRKNKQPPTTEEIRKLAEKYQEGRTSWNDAMEKRRVRDAKGGEKE